RDLAHARNDVLQLLAAAEPEPDAAVAREVAGARQYEISETREAVEGARIGAELDGEPADLREAAGDERGARVVPEAETIAHAGRERDDVLDCPPDLDADHVSRGVHAERRPVEEMLELLGDAEVARRGGHRGRDAARHFASEARAREHRDACPMVGEHGLE